ncbi:hypothetical protein Echvi_0128 [Echinicola vietnamensis DSM 17526]|uniref:Uncharacterized protein n=1 Tax=Echinicola vietnamensis (strain DSM 17526 / LMG 23754 / KMM 6221) TaxID=926556 RepID=L0FUR6_ECHVK|nr:hypothetical protein Echvi_0128 [Echinicola vietnamensis DSM 17526]
MLRLLDLMEVSELKETKFFEYVGLMIDERSW